MLIPKPQFSVYFVAFDGEESGCRGSQEFIYSHLKPYLEATGGKSQGAYILDTVLNYDKRSGSQAFSKVSGFMHSLMCRLCSVAQNDMLNSKQFWTFLQMVIEAISKEVQIVYRSFLILCHLLQEQL